MKIYTKNGKIHTRISSKECDPHAYLLPTSCHPTHIYQNIPYGVLCRVKRNCSEPEVAKEEQKKYIKFLKNRNYSDECIQLALEKLATKTRKELYQIKEKEDATDRCFPLVVRYNPSLPKVSTIINKHKHILELSPTTAEIFKPSKIFTSFKVEKSLKGLLTCSKYKPQAEKSNLLHQAANGECKECELGCHLCKKDFLKKGKVIKSYECRTKFYLNVTVNCKSKYIIYLVLDIVCMKSYVGYTTDEAKDRFSNHKSHIKNLRKTCTVVRHFVNCKDTKHIIDRSNQNIFDKQLAEQLKFQIIDQITDIPENATKDEIKSIMMNREADWQTRLCTFRDDGGLNVRNSRTEVQT